MAAWKFRNQRGFSIVEIMVAAGMLGGMSLLVAKLMENSKRGIKSAEIRNEYIVAQNRIAAVMADEVSCYETLKSIGVSAAAQSDVDEIVRCSESIEEDHPLAATDPLFLNVKIRRCNSSVTLYDNATEYGDGNFTMEYKFVVNNFVAAGGAGVGSGSGELQILFKRTNKGRNMSDAAYDITRKVEVIFEHDDTNLIKCYNNESNMINTAVARACTGPNARLIGSPNDSSNPLRCVHDVDVNPCASDEVLNGYLIDEHSVTNEAATLVPNCVKLADVDPNATCGSNEYLYRNSAGKISCHEIPKCLEGENLIRGSDKLLICQPWQVGSAVNGCGAGAVLQIKSDRTLGCVACPAGSIVVKTTTGVTCSAPTCQPHERFTGFNNSGVAQCEPMYDVMCGVSGSGQHVGGRVLKELTFNSGTGRLEATCCNPNCSGASNVCVGEAYNDPAGCRFCVGTKPRVDAYWANWSFSTNNGHNEGWNAETEFGATAKSCRAKDGGSAQRARHCLPHGWNLANSCNGMNNCTGDTAQAVTCAPAQTASGNLSGSGSIIPAGRYVVPGTFKLYMIGGGGGGGGSHDGNKKGGGGGKKGNSYSSNNAFPGMIITSCTYSVGGGGSGGGLSGNGSAGGTTTVTCNGSTRSASGGAGGVRGANSIRGAQWGENQNFDAGKGLSGSGGEGPGCGAHTGGNAGNYGAGGGGGSFRCGGTGGKRAGGGAGSAGRIWYEYKYTTY